MHLLPDNANIKYHFGFKNYAKIIYPHDIAVIEALLNEQSKNQKFESHKNDISLKLFQKLKKTHREETKQWEKILDKYIEELFMKWGIYQYQVNADAYTGLVIEGTSHIYGEVVMKIYPPFLNHRFKKETTILTQIPHYHQCTVYDLDFEKNAMLLDRIIPGDYIDFETDQKDIAQMFIDMNNNKKKSSEGKNIECLKDVLELTENEYLITSKIDYHQELMAYLMDEMRKVYDHYFINDEKYMLHGDAYFKNALRSHDGVVIIDPVGYSAPFIFEYMPFFTYEILWHSQSNDYAKKYNELIDFFKSFTDVSLFKQASFAFFIKQIVPSVYEANDGYVRANSYLDVIKKLYLDENNHLKDNVFNNIYM